MTSRAMSRDRDDVTHVSDVIYDVIQTTISHSDSIGEYFDVRLPSILSGPRSKTMRYISLIFCRWNEMVYISSHAKIQQPGPNILAVTAFSNLHDNSMVAMETNGLTNFSHRPSTCPPSLVPFCSFSAEKKAVKVMSYTLGYIELDKLTRALTPSRALRQWNWSTVSRGHFQGSISIRLMVDTSQLPVLSAKKTYLK